jgi:hypothetical protein
VQADGEPSGIAPQRRHARCRDSHLIPNLFMLLVSVFSCDWILLAFLIGVPQAVESDTPFLQAVQASLTRRSDPRSAGGGGGSSGSGGGQWGTPPSICHRDKDELSRRAQAVRASALRLRGGDPRPQQAAALRPEAGGDHFANALSWHAHIGQQVAKVETPREHASSSGFLREQGKLDRVEGDIRRRLRAMDGCGGRCVLFGGRFG